MPKLAASPDGQILVLFALSLVVLIGMTGLALDGGSAFAQRRDQQTAADLAALAAANDYLINNDDAQAIDAALRSRPRTASRTASTARSWLSTSTPPTVSGVTVGIDTPHREHFPRRSSAWRPGRCRPRRRPSPASRTRPSGASPFIFSIGAFDDDGTPKYQTPRTSVRRTVTSRRRDGLRLDELRDRQRRHAGGRRHHHGSLEIDKTLEYGEYIGQHNNGNHTRCSRTWTRT